MKKFISSVFLVTSFINITLAQSNTIAKFKFEEAEQAYLSEDYAGALSKLDETENLLKKLTPNILYLRIISQNQLLESNPHEQSEMLLALKKNCKTYLKECEKLEINDKYKEVYLISDYLKIYSDNLDFYQARSIFYSEIPNVERMLSLCNKAIAAGDHHALNLMGLIYMSGNGVERDYKTATEWYLKAADKGNIYGLTNMGDIYIEGSTDVNLDPIKAISFYQKAASQGYPVAMYKLGSLYYFGEIIPEDYIEAMKWFLKAADRKNGNAMHYIGRMYDLGYGVAENTTTALSWYRKAAARKSAISMDFIGISYYYGASGVEKNYIEALKWYKQAANSGYYRAYLQIGDMYEKGIGIPKDYKEALAWYKRGADYGNDDAMFKIGELYYLNLLQIGEAPTQNNNGNQIIISTLTKTNNVSNSGSFSTPSVENIAEAIFWYRKSAELENANSYYKLGQIYHHGTGVVKDYAQAMSWYLKAAELQIPEAMTGIGDLYKNGLGVLRDKKTANIWYLKAEETKILIANKK